MWLSILSVGWDASHLRIRSVTLLMIHVLIHQVIQVRMARAIGAIGAWADRAAASERASVAAIPEDGMVTIGYRLHLHT